MLFRDVEHILAAALLPWFFLTPILWRFADAAAERAGPPDAARRAALGQLRRPADLRGARLVLARPRAAAGDAIYLAVAAVVALALGAYVFSRRRPDRDRALTGPGEPTAPTAGRVGVSTILPS